VVKGIGEGSAGKLGRCHVQTIAASVRWTSAGRDGDRSFIRSEVGSPRPEAAAWPFHCPLLARLRPCTVQATPGLSALSRRHRDAPAGVLFGDGSKLHGQGLPPCQGNRHVRDKAFDVARELPIGSVPTREFFRVAGRTGGAG
jgi:hypothetical protein